jgi:hypothetical protein
MAVRYLRCLVDSLNDEAVKRSLAFQAKQADQSTPSADLKFGVGVPFLLFALLASVVLIVLVLWL